MSRSFLKRRVAVATLTLLFLVSIRSLATGDTIYNFVSYPDDQSQANLSGFIQTDGNTGLLSEADIVSWTVNIVSSSGSLLNQTPGGAILSGLYATDTTLSLSSSPDAVLAIGNAVFEIDWYRQGPSNGPNRYVEHNLTGGGGFWNTTNPLMGGTDTWVIAQVPEPSTLILFGIGAIGLLGYTRRWGV